MIKYGTISEVKPGYARVNFDDDEIVSDWLPVVVRKSLTDKESWQLEINEHVACVMDVHIDDEGVLHESCDVGVIIGAIASDEDVPDPGEAAGKFRKLFTDGTLIEYDKDAGKLTVDVKGEISAKATGDISVDTDATLKGKAATIDCEATGTAKIKAPTITMDGNLIISGSVTAAGALTAASIATSGGGAITGSGSMTINGSVTATGDVIGASKSLAGHTHPIPSGNTGAPN